MSNKLEQLEFKLEKLLGFRNMQEKLENNEPRRCQCHPDHLLQLKACQDLVHPHRQTLQSQRAQPRHQEIPFEFYLNK